MEEPTRIRVRVVEATREECTEWRIEDWPTYLRYLEEAGFTEKPVPFSVCISNSAIRESTHIRDLHAQVRLHFRLREQFADVDFVKDGEVRDDPRPA